MDGYGNPRGFTTVFDGNPVKEYLTGYENVAPEQIGLPAAANLKDPEIQQFKDLNTFNQQAFDNFMQLDGIVKDYAIKLKAAGVNINSPRNRDEIAAVIEFNNFLKERNKLGFILSQERGVADKAVQVAGTQDVVFDPNFNQYTPQGLNAATMFTPAATRMTQMFPTEKFANQEQADAYNQQRQMIAQQLMEAYQLTPEQAAASPEFAQAVEQGMRQKTGLLGVGVVDQNLADEQNLKRFEAQTRRINATRPTGMPPPPEPPDLLSGWYEDLKSSDSNKVNNAFKFAGFNNFKITLEDGKQVEPTIAFPLVFAKSQGNRSGMATGKVVVTTDPTLKSRMSSGEVKLVDGVLKEMRNNKWEAVDVSDTPYRLVNIGEEEQTLINMAAQQKTSYQGEKINTKSGVNVRGTQGLGAGSSDQVIDLSNLFQQ